ncbi:MAG: O-antigen ligase family protein [bacterium]
MWLLLLIIELCRYYENSNKAGKREIMNLSVIEKIVKKALETMLLASIFFMPLIFFTQANDPFWVVEKFFFKVAVIMLVCIFLTYCLIKKQFPLLKTPYDIAFIIFIVLNFLGIFSGVNVYAWSDRVFINLAYIVIYYLVGWSLLDGGTKNLNKLIFSALASGVIMAIYGLLQAGGMDFMPWRTTFNGRAASTLGNPNFLAGHMVLLIPVAYALAAEQGSMVRKGLLFVTAALLTAALFASQTRGAYVGFIVSIIVLFLLVVIFLKDEFRKNKKVIMVLSLIMLVLIGTFFLVKKDAVQRIADIVSLKDDSARIRVDLWKNTLYLIKDNPLLGTGAGNFYIKYPFYQAKALTPQYFKDSDYYKSGHAHNDFIQFAAEYGILGAGTMFLLFGLMFYSSLKYLKYSEKKGILVAGIIAAFAGLMVHAFFNFPFQIIPTAALFYMFAAIASYKQGNYSLQQVKLNIPVVIFIIVLSVCLIAESVLAIRVLAADTYLRKAKESEHFSKMYEAVSNASIAAELNPWNDENIYYYAQILEKTGNYEKSFDTYKAVYALNPTHWETLNALFNFYAMKNDEKGRIEISDKMYKISPYSEKAASVKGYTLYASGKFDEAVEIYKKALTDRGESASLLSQLAACYGALGNVQQTLIYSDRALALDPKFIDAYYNKAVAYYRMKNIKAVRQNLAKLLEVAPNNDRAKGLLKVINGEKK